MICIYIYMYYFFTVHLCVAVVYEHKILCNHLEIHCVNILCKLDSDILNIKKFLSKA